jgi:5-methylthioadenosine/S-adenosylhomocysteine deaminase
MARLLITGGFVVTGDPDLGDIPVGDVLIEDGVITAITPRGPEDCVRVVGCDVQVINASGYYVTPGMIDTHRHMWESVLRAAARDFTFGEYFAGILTRYSPALTAADMKLAGTLAAYEAIDSGVTTVLDWCHDTLTVDHAQGAIDGMKATGIRFVFAYGPPHIEWFDSGGQPTPAQVRAIYAANFANSGPDALGSMALAIRGPEFSTMERVTADITLARELGIPVTMHAGIPGFYNDPDDPRNTVVLLNNAGLLGPDLTFVHNNAMIPSDFDLIASTGGHVSLAPEVEMQMGLGAAPVRSVIDAGLTPSLSVDVVVAAPGDLLTQGRFALQTQRMIDQQTAAPTDPLDLKAAQVWEWMTTGGAATLGMSASIGTLSVGKRGDVLLVRADDTNTIGFTAPGGQLPLTDAGGAIAMFAHPGNIRYVIVDGRVVKEKGCVLGWDRTVFAARLREAQARITA